MVAIFGVGATVGYAAHRAPEAAPPAQPQVVAPQVVAPAFAPPTRVVVIAPVAPPPVVAAVPDDAAPEPDDAAAANDEPLPRGVLEGKVTDARTGDPVYGVEIYAESLVAPTQVTRSDSDGRYRITDLRSAAYTVRFNYGRQHVERGAGVNQLDPTELDVQIDGSHRYYEDIDQ